MIIVIKFVGDLVFLPSRYLNKSTDKAHAGELVIRLSKAADVHPDTIYALVKLLKFEEQKNA